MGLNKSKGNMYDWCTHTHSHLEGKCPHACSYCYVQAMERRWKTGKYVGKVRLNEKELNVNYGSGKVIFIEHMNDLFAKDIPDKFIIKILKHCCMYLKNKYVFQTKNPGRVFLYEGRFPNEHLLGTTLETNRLESFIGNAQSPKLRYLAMKQLSELGCRTFVTCEPILDFDVDKLADWIIEINPEFVNIGADSKGHGLIEPSAKKILELISILKHHKICIRRKSNLDRILGENKEE